MKGADRKTAVNNSSVFIICPYPLVCEGLRLLLGQDEDAHVVGAAADANAALVSLARLLPDVVLIVSVVDEGCAAAVRVLKAVRPELSLLILSSDTRPEQVQAALSAGAAGYLPFSAHPDELIRAILTAGRGEVILHPAIVPPLLAYLAGQSQAETHPDQRALSPRQQEALACLARGLSDRDIAQELFISVRTVQTHLAHIYAKLGVHSRTEAAVLAVRAGWFSEDQPNQ